MAHSARRLPLSLTLLTMTVLLLLNGKPLESQSSWTKVKEENGITVYSRTVPGKDLLAFKGECVLEVPTQKVLWVLCDNDRRKDWVINLQKSEILERKSKHEAVQYQAFTMPWFVSDRDFVSHAKVTRERRTGRIFADIEGCTHKKAPKTVGVRAEIVESHWILSPVNKSQHTKIEVDILCDPKGWLPTWLVNMIQKDWPIKTLSALKKQVKKSHVKLYPLPPLRRSPSTPKQKSKTLKKKP